MTDFITKYFVPARLHVREQPDDFKRWGERYSAQWTPTILVLSPTGEERHRIEGFLPADDLLSQLALGLGHVAFARGDFQTAERWFRTVVEDHPKLEAAAEALYWAGVSRYKSTGDPSTLVETARQFRDRYQDTSWAKKASVWGQPAG